MNAARRIEMTRNLSMRCAALEKSSFRLANHTTPALAIARDEAIAASDSLRSLLFALEIAGVDVQVRQEVREAIDDIELLLRRL